MKKILLLIGFVAFLSSPLMGQTSDAPYGLRPIEVYSIFYENYKNEDFSVALRYGRWLIHNKPHKIEGMNQYDGPRQFRRMANAYSGIAEKRDDPNVKTTYLDSAIYVYDLAMETYTEDEIDYFDWKLRKGRFYQKHTNYITDAEQKAFQIYEALMDEYTKRFTQEGEGYYARVTIDYFVNQDQKNKALQYMKRSEQFASDKLVSYYDEVRNQLYESPEERISYLEGELKDEPKNTEHISELAELHRNMEQYEEAANYSHKLYELEPTFENTQRVAEIAMDNGNYSEAAKFYEEAIEKTEDNDQIKTILLELSEIAMNQDNLQQARRHARDAMDYDSDWGRPYIQMASIYAEAISQCSTNKMTRKDKAVYWLVLDYLDRAKNVDSSVSSIVDRQYKSYKSATPTVEEKFYQNWETGNKLKVDGSLDKCYDWINETTTVR